LSIAASFYPLSNIIWWLASENSPSVLLLQPYFNRNVLFKQLTQIHKWHATNGLSEFSSSTSEDSWRQPYGLEDQAYLNFDTGFLCLEAGQSLFASLCLRLFMSGNIVMTSQIHSNLHVYPKCLLQWGITRNLLNYFSLVYSLKKDKFIDNHGVTNYYFVCNIWLSVNSILCIVYGFPGIHSTRLGLCHVLPEGSNQNSKLQFLHLNHLEVCSLFNKVNMTIAAVSIPVDIFAYKRHLTHSLHIIKSFVRNSRNEELAQVHLVYLSHWAQQVFWRLKNYVMPEPTRWSFHLSSLCIQILQNRFWAYL
jgi:hypothetical protein